MKRRLAAVLILLGMCLLRSAVPAHALEWSRLPDVPDAQGFAGTFAGTSNGALLVAGGANITGDIWSGLLHKKWYDEVFVLDGVGSSWQRGFHLPQPCAYGVSVSVPQGIACLGGSDATRHFSQAFILKWENGELHRVSLPDLPSPCADACGAVLNHTIYLAGGSIAPTAVSALHSFWSLDLADERSGWRKLESWPGPARILPVAGVAEGKFFLFSGAELKPGPDGKPMRTYLRDAYAYSPGSGWKRLANLPRAAVGAPSPALATTANELIIVSGDDGRNVSFHPVRNHPGFPHTLLTYHLATDQWETSDTCPFSRATAPSVSWNGSFVIPNGEVRPRVRTAEVWQARVP